MIVLKSDRELALMREAGRIVAEVHARLREIIQPGVTTAELNALAEEIIIGRHGAIPSFKGYRGFPASVCTSINEQVVHGIPGPRVLLDGDIVSIDVGVIHKGYQGDAAFTAPVGHVSAEAARLMDVTLGSLMAGIGACRPGQRLGDVSSAIQRYVEARGYSVVREYTGHGIGQQMHEDPQIPNFGLPGRGPKLRRGMTLALEPMVNVGGWKTRVLNDHWTVVTADGTLSAHYEHTVAVTKDGPEILTRL
jgi:methionyl aminopeptidase